MSEKVIVHTDVRADRERIWRALTEPKEMKQWFFDSMESFSAEPGFHTEFDVRNGDTIYPHLWTVKNVVVGRLIACEWRFGGYDGTSMVTFTLDDRAETTRVTVTADGLETFPRENPDFSPESCRRGWIYFLDRLKNHLEH